MQAQDTSDLTLEQLTTLFSAIADPTRARILLLLRGQAQRSGEIAAALEMTPSAVSHQLRWLREKRLIAAEKQGREVTYSLIDACIQEILEVALRHLREGQESA